MHQPDTSTPHLFDARGIARRFRHAALFGALESLHEGESIQFINDHDPVPLLDHLRQRYGQQVSIQYQSRAPEQVVLTFTVHPHQSETEAQAAQQSGGGCGGGGHGCGCSGG